MQRINVDSGRPLEARAHYSRAIRFDNWVLQSGTTAIDTEGNVIGEGDIVRQVHAIMEIAQQNMSVAGGRLEDVVRMRVYLTDMSLADAAATTLAEYFRDVRPTSTLVQVARLAREQQLIEIELDAVDGAAERARRYSSGRPTEDRYAYSRAVRIDDHVIVSGSTALQADGSAAGVGSLGRQSAVTMDTIGAALDALGASMDDVVYSKSFVTTLEGMNGYRDALLGALGSIRPTSTLLAIPALITPELLVEIEVDAIVGAAERRREVFGANDRERPLGYARAVAVDDWIHVSGCTSLGDAGQVQAEGDWARQYDLCHEAIADALGKLDASLDDVVMRRIFTVADAEQNRAYGEGPGWFSMTRPASMGCRISALARPQMLVEVEAMARRGANQSIDWREAGTV